MLKILDASGGVDADWATIDAMVDWFNGIGGNDLNGNPPLISVDDTYWVGIKKKADDSAYILSSTFDVDAINFGAGGFLGLVPDDYNSDRYDVLTNTGAKIEADVAFGPVITFAGDAAGKNFCVFYLGIENTSVKGEVLRFLGNTDSVPHHAFHGCYFKSIVIPLNTLKRKTIYSYCLVNCTGSNQYGIKPEGFADPTVTNTVVIGDLITDSGYYCPTNGIDRPISINTIDLCNNAIESFRTSPDTEGAWGAGTSSNAAWDGLTNTPQGSGSYPFNLSLSAGIDFVDPANLDFRVVGGSGLSSQSGFDNFSIYESGNYNNYSVDKLGTSSGDPLVYDLYGNHIVDGSYIKQGVQAFVANSSPNVDFISGEYHLYSGGKPRLLAKRDLQTSDADNDTYFFNITSIPTGFTLEKFNGSWSQISEGTNSFTQADIDTEHIRLSNNNILSGDHNLTFTLEDSLGNTSAIQTLTITAKDSAIISTAQDGTFIEIPDSSPKPYFAEGWGGTGSDGARDSWSRWRYIPTMRCMLFWGGGHNDSYDNNGYCFDVDNFFWYVLEGFGSEDPSSYKDCSPSDDGAGDDTGVYSDGKPPSRHTYSVFQWVDNGTELGQIVVMGQQALANPLAGGYSEVEIFDLNSKVWLNTVSNSKFTLPWDPNKAPNVVRGNETWVASLKAGSNNLVSYNAELETNFSRNLIPVITSNAAGHVTFYHKGTNRVYIFGDGLATYYPLPSHESILDVNRTDISLINSDNMENDNSPPVFVLNGEIHVWRGDDDIRVLNTDTNTFANIGVDGGNSFTPISKALGWSFSNGAQGAVQGVNGLYGKATAVTLDSENANVFVWVKSDEVIEVEPDTYETSIATDLTSQTSTLNLSHDAPSYNLSLNAQLTSQYSTLTVTNTKPIWGVDLSSSIPLSESNLTAVATKPNYQVSISSDLSIIESALTVTKSDPQSGVNINDTLPSQTSTLNLSHDVGEGGFNLIATLPISTSNLTITQTIPQWSVGIISIVPLSISNINVYNGELGYYVGVGNNVKVLVKSRNINLITQSRNIEV